MLKNQFLRLSAAAGAVLCAATLAAPAAIAQNYPPPPGYEHHWHQGDRFDGPHRIVHHWRRYHLAPPPYGYVWVQDHGHFLLIGPDGVISRVWN
jgi:hypothetical protein